MLGNSVAGGLFRNSDKANNSFSGNGLMNQRPEEDDAFAKELWEEVDDDDDVDADDDSDEAEDGDVDDGFDGDIGEHDGDSDDADDSDDDAGDAGDEDSDAEEDEEESDDVEDKDDSEEDSDDEEDDEDEDTSDDSEKESDEDDAAAEEEEEPPTEPDHPDAINALKDIGVRLLYNKFDVVFRILFYDNHRDEHLEQIRGLPNLKEVWLLGTKVTKNAAAELQERLGEDVKVYYE